MGASEAVDAETTFKPGAGSADPAGISAELLARVRMGDESAAETLVDRLHPLVARVVQAHLPRRDEPEDLIQEVFLKVFSRLEQFVGHVPLENWVARIAHTTCLDRLRRQKARPEFRWADLTTEEQALLDSTAGEIEPVGSDSSSAAALLDKLLAQLSPNDAWLLRRVDLEEKSLSEICTSCGWTAVAGRVRLFRARRRLQALLHDLESQIS